MSRPLRIVHVTTFYPPHNFGGDGRYVERLSRRLAAAGHQIDVAYSIDAFLALGGRDAPVPPPPPGIRTHGHRGRPSWLAPVVSHATGWPALARASLQRVLDRASPDVIHYHNVSLFGPGVLTMRPRMSPPPLKVYTTHEHWLVCPTHVLWKFNQRACERPQCLPCTVRAGRPPQLWRLLGLERRVAGEVDRFLAPSRFTATLHRDRGFPGRFAHLPLFVEPSATDASAPPAPHDAPYCLFVGRLERIKGLEPTIETWRRVRGVDLLVAGDGSQADALRSRAGGLASIRFLGRLDRGTLGRYYAHALACVVPSLVPEVSPTVILEAFAHRTPVVGRALGGIPELLEDSGGGTVYRTEDELVDLVHALAADSDRRRRLGDRGHAAYGRWWTPEAHLTRYLALLASLARDKLGRVPWQDDA